MHLRTRHGFPPQWDRFRKTRHLLTNPEACSCRPDPIFTLSTFQPFPPSLLLTSSPVLRSSAYALWLLWITVIRIFISRVVTATVLYVSTRILFPSSCGAPFRCSHHSVQPWKAVYSTSFVLSLRVGSVFPISILSPNCSGLQRGCTVAVL
jgi:hypothetical protein